MAEVDQHYYSLGNGRQYWDVTYPGYAKSNPITQEMTYLYKAYSPAKWAEYLAQQDAKFAARPHGIGSVIAPASIIGGILAAGITGGATLALKPIVSSLQSSSVQGSTGNPATLGTSPIPQGQTGAMFAASAAPNVSGTDGGFTASMALLGLVIFGSIALLRSRRH